jgi:PHD/YefM family antitoxin component YafN of YafNO toxin-antitoxin module
LASPNFNANSGRCLTRSCANTPYILTRGSRPEAVLLSYDQYIRLMRADETSVLKRFDALLDRMERLNAHYSEAEVEADLREATQRVRSRKRK